MSDTLLNDEFPREKLLKFGADHLTDAELIAVLLRVGGRDTSSVSLARSLIRHYGNLNALLNVPLLELINYKNIGVAKACTLKATFELGLRINFNNTSRKKVKTPRDVFNVLKKDFFSKNREHFFLLSVDSRNRLISKDLLAIGTLNETVAHPREVFKRALQVSAVAIIVAHNHPSGDVTPSQEDIDLTNVLAKSGKLLGIPLMDHVIISQNEYVSIRSLGLFTIDKVEI